MEPIWWLVAVLVLMGLGVRALRRTRSEKRKSRPVAVRPEHRAAVPSSPTQGRPPAQSQDSRPPVLLRGSTPQVTVRLVGEWTPSPEAPGTLGITRDPSQFWVPPGRRAQVGQWNLHRGAVYVGTRLTEGHSWRNGVEPALIDPDLPAEVRGSYREDPGVGYWPTYQRMSPAARGAYLNWLAAPAFDPAANIGFVFLFFYGLERRALLDARTDAAARGEIPAIGKLVRALREVYAAGNASFARYSAEFLGVLETRDPSDPNRPPPAQALIGQAEGQAMRIRLGLGMRVRAGLPIDTNWALCWARNDSEIALRTPAQRCAVEFNQLFARRFAAKYPKSLTVPENKTPLRVLYQPASPGLDAVADPVEIDGRQVPDVMVLKRPKQAIQAIADACMEDLGAYSRWLGKNPDQGDSLPGLALLPRELLRERETQSLERFRTRLAQAVSGPEGGLIDAAELFRVWPTAQADRFSKPEAVGLFQLMESLGYGIEPDIRFGAPRIGADQKIAVFDFPSDAPSAPSAEYIEAATLLHLAAMVSQADAVSQEEERHLEELIEGRLRLTPPERVRLRAHIKFLLANPVDTGSLKKRLVGLPRTEAELIADLLVGVAAADGRIDPSEVRILGRLFRSLGLDESDLHRRMHGAASATAGPPPQPGPKAKPTQTKAGVALDPERLRQRQESTHRVAALLQGVFGDQEDEVRVEPSTVAAPAPSRIDGLDPAYTAFFLALGERDAWDRDALAALAAHHRLMPDGAIDRLNEMAFERCDAPLLDGDEDGFELDRDTWETLRHGETA